MPATGDSQGRFVGGGGRGGGGARKTGDWGKARRELATLGAKALAVARQAILQEAHFLRGKMVEGIREQAPGGQRFKALSPLTLAARRLAGFRGTKALVRTGTLRNAITVVERGGQVFIGILRTARGEDGDELTNVAAVHEFGAGPFVVQITDKMRAYLGALLEEAGILPAAQSASGGGRGYLVIRIPARPFIGPVFKKFGKPADVRARLQERVAKLLNRSTGR